MPNIGTASSSTTSPQLVPIVKTAAYTAVASNFVLADATSAAFTVTLPSVLVSGTVVGVKKTDSSTNIVTVVGSGVATIDGDATLTLVSQDAAAVLQFDGTNWQIQSTATVSAAAAPVLSGADGLYSTGLYKTGSWYSRKAGSSTPTMTSNTATSFAPNVNQVYYSAQYLFKSVTVDQVAIFAGGTAPTAGATIRLGAYTMNTTTFGPGALLYEFGVVSPVSASTAYAITGLTATLPKGWIYWAFSMNGTAMNSMYSLSSLPGVPVPNPGMSTLNPTNAIYGNTYNFYYEGGTTGAALAATATPIGNVNSNASPYSPDMYFHVVSTS